MENIKIGDQIKALRNRHGITQVSFAKAIHISPQAVSKWERNINYPDIHLLPIIARFFGTTIDALFTVCDPEQ